MNHIPRTNRDPDMWRVMPRVRDCYKQLVDVVELKAPHVTHRMKLANNMAASMLRISTGENDERYGIFIFEPHVTEYGAGHQLVEVAFTSTAGYEHVAGLCNQLEEGIENYEI